MAKVQVSTVAAMALVAVVLGLVAYTGTAEAHTTEIAWRVEPNCDVTFFAGTYHLFELQTPRGGVIVDGTTYNFTSFVTDLPGDIDGVEYWDTSNWNLDWQVATVSGLSFGTHTLTTTGTSSVEWPYPPGPLLSVIIEGECDGEESDDTPPDLTVPADITMEATGPTGATVSYSASAEDGVDGAITPLCAPESGTMFSIGTTLVTCTAEDEAGNIGSQSFNVTVRDTTPPDLNVPAPITVETDAAAGLPASDASIAAFLAGASASDIVDPAPSVANDAPAQFPVGTTEVEFTATDASDNSVSATSSVTVVLVVDVDIKPNSDPNSINLKSKGMIPVAILTTDDFDASTVDGSSVTFEGASPAHGSGHLEDVDGDGDIDWVGHFKTQETGLDADSEVGSIEGQDIDGTPFVGSDSVNIVPKKK